ncbi:MAG: DEAD/DEAH box helicase [Archaeoglobaceae archaeon]|nr:DEAD/DEAH box helicase [Archaeoglobaceae archaeon]MDW8013884.1 DEAD/DEAH box helicase [Archaeoglobaceae archaeon]
MREELLNAIKEVGILELTDMQKKARELILSGEDVIIVAPTGTGKTEAAIIPIFEKLLEMEKKSLLVLYITPLRALNRDMFRRLIKIAEKLKIRVEVRHGDTPQRDRVKQSKNPPEIMITTPETFQILFLGKRLKESLKNIKFVVIDEIHELADSKRGVQLSIALERLREYTNFQTIALSATVGDPEKVAKFFGMKNVKVVSGEKEKKYEFYILKDKKDNLELIKEILKKENALIFVNTRRTSEALGLRLKEKCEVEVHHGSLSREVRIEAEEKFAKGELRALVCTSSMELGIDIGHVSAVVQYNSPRQVVKLLQRVGRSGHGLGRVSRGYIVAENFDEILEAMAIVDLARKNVLEEPELHFKSLDVLANQICSLALEYKRIDLKKAYEIVKRAEAYKDLSFEEFLEICKFLAEIDKIKLDDKVVATSRTRKYFYENISMIPDEKQYKVYDVSSGKVIGTLDESFLSTFSGEVFAMKGEFWRVLSVDEFVKVEPYTGEGEVPSWVGEEIPVPFEVAQRVGKIREEIAKKGIPSDYNLNEGAVEEILKVFKEKPLIPTHELVTIEGNGTVFLNACFGSKVNEGLGRILAMLLSLKKGVNVSVEIDPYRIKLEPARAEEVKQVLLEIDTENLENLAERSLIETKLMQWKVVNSARKFGLFEKGDDVSRINLKNLVIKLRGTPIYREALREIFLEKVDLKKLSEVVKKIKNKEIKIVLSDKVSSISLISKSYSNEVFVTRSEESVLKIFKEAILNSLCKVLCLNCGASYTEVVRNFSRFNCMKCGSRMIAVYNSKRVEPGRLELLKIANLVKSYGIRAVYAMNTFGVGAETASKILGKIYENDDAFFKALMKAERDFIRTRKFWS